MPFQVKRFGCSRWSWYRTLSNAGGLGEHPHYGKGDEPKIEIISTLSNGLVCCFVSMAVYANAKSFARIPSAPGLVKLIANKFAKMPGRLYSIFWTEDTLEEYDYPHPNLNDTNYDEDVCLNPIPTSETFSYIKPLKPWPVWLWPLRGAKMRVTIAQRSDSGWQKTGDVITTEAIEGQWRY